MSMEMYTYAIMGGAHLVILSLNVKLNRKVSMNLDSSY